MAYRAYLDNSIFFDTSLDDPAVKLLQAKLSLQAGKSGTFSFQLASGNVAYDSFTKMKSLIDVYRDDELIYSGRVYKITKDFYNRQTVVCEDMMAVLNDSVFAPQTFNGTITDLINAIISSHNTQVEASKQLTVRNVTVQDEYLYRAYEAYDSTKKRLDDLVKSYGGFMQVEKADGVLYFDWFQELTDSSSQTIDFGSNLLDITRDTDSAELLTVLVPLGAEKEDENGNKSRITVESVNDGSIYLEKAAAISEYGRIVGLYVFDDVTTPAALLAKGTAKLNELSTGKVSISVSAVDLSNVDASIDGFRIGKTIRVRSEAHGLDAEFLCSKLNLDLLNPSSDKLTLGSTFQGLAAMTTQGQRDNTRRIESIIADYVTNERVNGMDERLSGNISELSSEIAQAADRIASMVSQIDTINGTVNEMKTTVEQTAAQYAIYFDEGGKIVSWFRFENDKFIIGKTNYAIHSEQTSGSYSFVDASDNILLTINSNEVRATTLASTAQLKISTGSIESPVDQWAIRKGKYRAGVGVNLNDVWIGG